MVNKKSVKVEKDEGAEKPVTGFVFSRMNYRLLIIGLVVILLGFLLMAGGGSEDPNRWDPSIFSFRRITLGPIVVLAGFIIEGVAIMYRPKSKKQE